MRRQPWEGAPWEPRAWQREAIPAVQRELARGRRTVVCAIMGAGKSVAIAELCWLAAARGRVVVSTPTQALVRQLARTIRERVPDCGEYYADAKDLGHRVTVCCNPSLDGLAELEGEPLLWIADEAHRTEAVELIEASRKLRPQYSVAFTATPYRGQEGERLSLWDSVAYSYSMDHAIRDGVLVPPRWVPWDGGETGLDEACMELIREKASGPGIISAFSIADAEATAALYSSEGIACQAVHSQLHRREIERRLEALEAGALDALVHVSLLAEGVDLPWLRWLCLRRRTGSRVRFCQEVGRVLRCSPGKAEGVLLDPHDLAGAHNISVAAELGEWHRPTPGEPRDELEEMEREFRMPGVVSVDATTRWTRAVVRRLLRAGLLEKSSSGPWRHSEPTEKQLQVLPRMLWAARWLPATVKAPIKKINRDPSCLRRGSASDVLSILFAAKEHREKVLQALQGAG